MMKTPWVIAGLAVVSIGIMTAFSTEKKDEAPAEAPAPGDGQEVATLGAGCFWCVEAVLEQVPGVASVTSGYMGGAKENPTYQEVCSGQTRHVEVVQVIFDPAKLSYEQLLEWFWKLHDPTQVNGQGNDIGPQYRSIIFAHGNAQAEAAAKSKTAAGKRFSKPIATEIAPASRFWPAEAYHQEYYQNNKGRNPYCPLVISPKLRKLGLEQ